MNDTAPVAETTTNTPTAEPVATAAPAAPEAGHQGPVAEGDGTPAPAADEKPAAPLKEPPLEQSEWHKKALEETDKRWPPATHQEVHNLAGELHSKLAQVAGGTSHELGGVKLSLENALHWLEKHLHL